MTATQTHDVSALRAELAERKCPGRTRFTDYMLRRVLDKMPDAELAATAIMMIPRPTWVREILGR